MLVIKDYRKIKHNLKQPVVATIGIFDGVHIGHREIINRCINKAKRNKGTSFVITFYPHPLKIISPKLCPPLIMSFEQRLNIFKELGVNACVVMNFNKEFAKVSAEKFVVDIVIKTLKIRELFIGHNFRFGFKAEGDISLLKRLSRHLAFKVTTIKKVKFKGKPISSTEIRRLIEKGDLVSVKSLLGKDCSIYGTVIKGQGRGTKLGFSTANIKTLQEVLPPNGVYAVRVTVRKENYTGMLNIGTRPTFLKTPERYQAENIKPQIEVHLFNICKILYGEKMEISFVKKIREEKRFKDKYELIEQIRKDSVIAKAILNITPKIAKTHKGKKI
ncbi:MAG: bifunctional riboflavin kinase/FAD synthetase [Candidatus Omnitrophica bacterium]|nr:bifunctional riboflavin kinase/FAD synthetase [Candidatus Omnitrophota bacterium]